MTKEALIKMDDARNNDIIIFVEAPCKKMVSNAVSVLNVDTDLYDFLERVRKENPNIKILPVLSIFGEDLLKIAKAIKLVNIRGLSVDLRVLTPLGVLSEHDLIVPYKECFGELSRDDLDVLLSKRNIREIIYDSLESDFKLIIFCLSYRLIGLLDLDYYAPIDRPVIIVTEGYSSQKQNIYVITENHPLASYAPKKDRLSVCETVIKYLLKILSIENYRENIFIRLISNPKYFFEELFNLRLINKVLKKKIKTRQIDLRKFLQ